MGQSTVDLPDPLESAGGNPGNVQAQSADELLSQLAGDEIDRLLAESGEEPVAGKPSAETIPEKSTSPTVEAIGKPKKTPLEEEMDLDQAINTAARERMAIAADTDSQDASDHSPQIELGDSGRRLPLFLRPLEWLSAPLDPWPDRFRDLIGKIGLITTVNAVAVIAYVVIFKKHHH